MVMGSVVVLGYNLDIIVSIGKLTIILSYAVLSWTNNFYDLCSDSLVLVMVVGLAVDATLHISWGGGDRDVHIRGHLYYCCLAFWYSVIGFVPFRPFDSVLDMGSLREARTSLTVWSQRWRMSGMWGLTTLLFDEESRNEDSEDYESVS